MGLWKGNIQNLETIIFRFQRFNWGVDMVWSPGFHGAGPESQNLPSEGELEHVAVEQGSPLWNDVMNLTTQSLHHWPGVIGVKLPLLEACSIWQDENSWTSLCRSQLSRFFWGFLMFSPYSTPFMAGQPPPKLSAKWQKPQVSGFRWRRCKNYWLDNMHFLQKDTAIKHI